MAVVSGPSFAVGVGARAAHRGLGGVARRRVVAAVQAGFRAPYFRLYGTSDVVGVEIGGALKNVIAIAAGLVEGLGLGHNALAGLITRGLAEISRLACAAGAQRETLAGLTGLGDLVLTCTGAPSRNRRVGIELAHGRPLQDILDGTKMVAEGVRTTRAALTSARATASSCRSRRRWRSSWPAARTRGRRSTSSWCGRSGPRPDNPPPPFGRRSCRQGTGRHGVFRQAAGGASPAPSSRLSTGSTNSWSAPTRRSSAPGRSTSTPSRRSRSFSSAPTSASRPPSAS